MLAFLLSLAVISLSGVMMPGPMFAVTVAKSYKSRFAGIQIALGHAIVEIPLMRSSTLALPDSFNMSWCSSS